MRAVCTRVVVRRRLPQSKFLESLARVGNRWPAPSLDWNPVYWRERHRARPSRWVALVGGLYFLISFFFSLGTAIAQSGMMAAWVNGLQVSAGLLLLSVGAATSLAEERVRGSLDVLLTTRLTTTEVVLGKWLGTYRLVPLLAVCPSLVVLAFAWVSPQQWLVVPLFVAYVLSAGAAITSLGLAMATWCRRVGRAVAATVVIYVAIAAGWMFLVMALARMGPRTEGLLMASPFFSAGTSAFELASNGPRLQLHRDWAPLWTAASGLSRHCCSCSRHWRTSIAC